MSIHGGMGNLRKSRLVQIISHILNSSKNTSIINQQEANLPHSPRVVVFLNDGDTLCFGYTPSDYILFSLQTMTPVDISFPMATSTSAASIGSMGMSAFSGLGGYMTLGLGAKAKPNALRVTETEFLIAKEREWLLVSRLSLWD